MNRIFYIVFLFFAINAQAQSTLTGDKLILRNPPTSTDSAELIMVRDASGNVKKSVSLGSLQKANAGTDTAVIATKWYARTTTSDTATALRALMVSLFSGYYTKTQVDNFFTGYYTKTQSDARYLQSYTVDSALFVTVSRLNDSINKCLQKKDSTLYVTVTRLRDSVLALKTWVGAQGYLTSYTETDPVWNAQKGSYLTSAVAATTYASLSGSYANPTWLTSLAWSKLTGTPTTIAGYGITDATSTARSAISSSATGLTYTTGTGVFSLTSGYSIPTTSDQTNWTTAYTNRITSLTTTGSGAATLISNTLNIPTPSLSGLGGIPYTDTVNKIPTTYQSDTAKANIRASIATYTPQSRTVTINGTTQDLSANRTYTIPVLDTSIITVWSDTLDRIVTKYDVDSVENALKYVQLNNIISSAPLLDNVIMDGDTATWDKSFREIGNCIYWPKIGKWVYMYAGFIPPYDGMNIYLGVMTSTDLKTWTKVGTNGKVTTRAAEDPFLIVKGDSIYAYAEDKADNPFRNIRLFVSADGVTWTDKGDVLDIGASGSWDEGDVSSPVVKQIGDTVYMWYEGRGSGNGGAIGMAKSTNMYNWTKYGGNPVITGTQQANPTISWGTHVVCHDIEIVNDDIYLFVTPYVTSIPNFVQTAMLGNIKTPYKYKDYLGTWFTGRRDINVGGQQFYANNRYYLMSYDKTATKLTMIKFQNTPVSDFVNKPIVTDDSIRGKYIRVKNASGYTATIYNAGTADRNDTMPDKSGTIAMTSDIQTYTNGYGINKTGNTFSADTSSANGLVTQYDLASATPPTPTLQQVTTAGATTTDGVTLGSLTTDTVNGGTASGGNLQLTSTTNASKGLINLGANSYFDEANNAFQVGASAVPTNSGVSSLHKIRALNSGANSIIYVQSSGGTPIIQSRQSNGTLSAPTATTNGQILHQFLWDGYDGVNTFRRGGELRISASENWSNTAVGTVFSIQTAINGTTARTERIASNSVGNVILNSGGGTTIAYSKLLTNITTAPSNNNIKDYTFGSTRADDTSYADEAVVTAKVFATTPTKSSNPADSVLVLNRTTNEIEYAKKADTVVWAVAVSDLTTALTTGTNKAYFRMPYAATLVKVKASVLTVSSSGTPTFDINEEGTSVLGTKLSIDASEKSSETAASAATITDSSLARDAEIEIDIDTAGTSTAGAVVYLYWIKA